MTTGPHHYRRAEQLLNSTRDGHLNGDDCTQILAAAQVHATLALAAATAMSGYPDGMKASNHKAWSAQFDYPA